MSLDSSHIERIGNRAKSMAAKRNHEFVTTEHLLESLLEENDVIEILDGVNCDVDAVRKDLEEYYASGEIPVTPNKPPKKQTNVVSRVIQRAVTYAMMSSKSAVYGRDILVSLMSEENIPAVAAIKGQEITENDIKEFIVHGMVDDDEAGAGAGGAFGTPGEKSDAAGKMTDKKADGILSKYTVNLNEKAKQNRIDPLIGREDEIFDIVHTLARRTKASIALTGNPGVGKTQLAEGLAKLIAEDKVPNAIKDAIVYELDVTSLVAGTRYRGDFEERMKLVLKALEFKRENSKAQPILFIDEIHMIMGAGSASGSAMDVANIIKPELAKGKLRVIGSTTDEEFRKYFEKDRALLRRFQKVQIDEPSTEDAIRILIGLRSVYEDFHGVVLSEEAIEAAVHLSARYIHNRFLPDKAIDVIDGACARAKIKKDEGGSVSIGVKNVEYEISKIARIPEKTVAEDDLAKLEHLEQDIKLVVFGQDKAVETLADSVIESRAGLRVPTKPLGCFLFIGSSGCGKTEAAKQLAKSVGIPLIRFDMSEYQEQHAIAKLIGSPPGYVGYDDGAAGAGLLINEIDKNPHCVLLLDEIEKAHPAVYNLLLGVMDNGMLKASNGKEVSMRNCFIIMTSNAGARDAEKRGIGFGASDTNDAKMPEAVKRTFSPEFRNRLDEVIYFNKLKQEDILRVVNKFVDELNHMIKDRGVEIRLTDDARELLAKQGFDPSMGARPLGRVIQEKIKKPLSKEMLWGKLKNGGIVRVGVIGEGEDKVYTFDIEPSSAKALVE